MKSLAASAETSEVVGFSIEGEFLTDLCRSLVTEGKWRHALSILTDCLRGISTDQALSILKATHKLVGVNAVDLVKEDRTATADAYLRLLAFQFAGLWHRQDGEWQPYANVTCFGPGDVPRGGFAPQMYESMGVLSRRWTDARCRFYADNRREDICTSEPSLEHPTVLWRKIADPPLWLRGAETSAAAIDDFFARGRGLDERGGADSSWGEAVRASYAGDAAALRDLASEEDEAIEPTPVSYEAHDRLLRAATQVAATSAAADLADKLGFTGKMAEAVEAIVGTEDEADVEPLPDPMFCSESGYILPDGRFYGCKYMHHSRLAARLLRHVFGVEAEDPQKEADRRNWLRIQASAFIGSTPVGMGFVIMSPKNRPTKRQEISLASWCIAHKQPYPEDLR